MPEAKRRYSREETALILRRATEGEQRAPNELENGLTLAEIEAAARDAGIDPVAVRRAAAVALVEIDREQTRLLGAPVAPEVRARFDGVLPTDAEADFQNTVERSIGRRGEVTEDAAGLVWHEDHGLGRTTVSARQDGGAVAVSAEADRRGHLLALVVALATVVAIGLQPLGGFAGLAAVGGPLLALFGPLAAIATGTRLLWPTLERSVLRRLETAVLDVGAMIPPPVVPPALPEPSPQG